MQPQAEPHVQPSADRARITVYVDYDDLATLDELKAHFKRTERRSVDRSELIREAIRTYRARHMTEPDDRRRPDDRHTD